MAEKERKGRQDYLRAIYDLYEKGYGKGVRSVDIANMLKVSKASVSEMLRKLADEGLVKLEPYSKILFTAKGWKIAKENFEKHDVVKIFLQKYLRYDENKASEEAHNLEHAFSQDSINRLKEFVEGKKTMTGMPNYVG